MAASPFSSPRRSPARLAQRHATWSRRDSSLRALVTQIAWLDGRILWRDGRVAFRCSDGKTARTVFPDASDLARAQHALLRIAQSSRVGDALGGKTAWLLERQKRLEAAKTLREIVAPDLKALAKTSRERNPQTARRLAQLVVAEAFCLNELPFRPSAWLVRNAVLSREDVRLLVEEESTPDAARALAAMIYGALSRSGQNRKADSLFASDTDWADDDSWTRRAFRWGFERGLAANPALTTAFLRPHFPIEYSMECATRCEHIADAFHFLPFPTTALRTLLDDGAEGREVVDVAVAALRWEDAASLWNAQFRSWRAAPPETTRRLRALRQRALEEGRADALGKLAQTLDEFAGTSGDGLVLGVAGETVLQLLQRLAALTFKVKPEDYATFLSELNDALLQATRGALGLPPEAQIAYLQTLQSHLENKPTAVVPTRFFHDVSQSFESLRDLMLNCGDARLALEAFDKNLHRALAHRQWRDVRMLRWLLGFIESYDAPLGSWQVRSLGEATEDFVSVAQLRAVFDPLIHLSRALTPVQRASFLTAILQSARTHGGRVHLNLSRLVPHFPFLVDFVREKDEDNGWESQYFATLALEVEDSWARFDEQKQSDQAEQPDAQLLAFYSDAERDETERHRVLDASPTAPLAEQTSQTAACVRWALDFAQEEKSRDAFNFWQLKAKAHLAAILAGGEMARFQNLFRVALRTSWEADDGDLRKGLFVSREYDGFHGALSRDFAQHPLKTVTLLLRLGLAARLGAEVCAPLQQLRAPFDAEIEYSNDGENSHHEELNQENTNSENTDGENVYKESANKENVNSEDAMSEDAKREKLWRALQISPELSALVQKYRALCFLRGVRDELPLSVAKTFDEKRRRSQELESLEQMLREMDAKNANANAVKTNANATSADATSADATNADATNANAATATNAKRAHLEARAASLRKRLGDDEKWRRDARKLLGERLQKALDDAHLEFAQTQLMACYRARLRVVAGALPDELQLDADLLNAILLSSDIESNRRILRRLLRAHLAGDTNWRERYPANAGFLRSLNAQKIDATAWLGAHPKRYRFAHVADQTLRLHLETQPIRILQMGNYFDTCLSFGGCNAFSTVANASELNKRVIYATDKRGHVVGRKLIALNTQGQLVGFQTYTSLQNKDANAALRALFRRYIDAFAARCGLQLADAGEVAKLFADDWYDDGTVAWGSDDELAKPKAETTHRVLDSQHGRRTRDPAKLISSERMKTRGF